MSQFYVLDSSALLGYIQTLRPRVARPEGSDARTLADYHAALLKHWETIGTAGPNGKVALPIRIPDYVVYEVTGIMPVSLQALKKRLDRIDAQCAAQAGEDPLQAEATKAARYQQEIDMLADSSVRLDRRGSAHHNERPKTRDELVHFWTLFAYHRDMLLPTQLGRDFSQATRIESAVVAGVGVPPFTEPVQEYGIAIDAARRALANKQPLPDIAHYSIDFRDVQDALGADGSWLDGLRIHWNQMYFMGLTDEEHFKRLLRNGDTEKTGVDAQGYDQTRRFVTLGQLAPKGDMQRVTNEDIAKYVERQKNKTEDPQAFARKNFTFGDLKVALPEGSLLTRTGPHSTRRMPIHEAVGPAKITLDQLVASGLFPSMAQPDALSLVVRSLGYAWPEKASDEKIRQELKRQGCFERSITIGDLLRMEQAFHAKHLQAPWLERLLQRLPVQLALKPHAMAEEAKQEKGGIAQPMGGTPVERIFTDGLMSGAVNIQEFMALAVKFALENASLIELPYGGSNTRYYKIANAGLEVQFHIKDTVNPQDANARELADAIILDAKDPNTVIVKVPSILQGRGGKVALNNQKLPEIQTKRDMVKLEELVRSTRAARMNGEDSRFGYQVLQSIIRNGFERDAPGQMQLAKKTFGEMYGPEDGDTRFFQLTKDFETRHERRFTSDMFGGQQTSYLPALSAFASNHRNRRIARRNLGEVAVAEAAAQVSTANPGSQVWVVGHDSDIVTPAQNQLIDRPGRKAEKETMQQAGQQPGVTLHPQVMRQHSRYIQQIPMVWSPTAHSSEQGRCRLVPTRDFLDFLAKSNRRPPIEDKRAKTMAHRYLEKSEEFRATHLR